VILFFWINELAKIDVRPAEDLTMRTIQYLKPTKMNPRRIMNWNEWLQYYMEQDGAIGPCCAECEEEVREQFVMEKLVHLKVLQGHSNKNLGCLIGELQMKQEKDKEEALTKYRIKELLAGRPIYIGDISKSCGWRL
tara:strand:- start:115 stop:525 length:411 start_codon:yes stop_codon:yes gene_type:complete